MPEDFPCIPFVRTRQVAFHDTDASGVAHFSRLLCLVEEVEHEYLRSRGVEVLSPDCGSCAADEKQSSTSQNHGSPFQAAFSPAAAVASAIFISIHNRSLSW